MYHKECVKITRSTHIIALCHALYGLSDCTFEQWAYNGERYTCRIQTTAIQMECKRDGVNDLVVNCFVVVVRQLQTNYGATRWRDIRS